MFVDSPGMKQFFITLGDLFFAECLKRRIPEKKLDSGGIFVEHVLNE
jgi:hypothetical protein